MLLKILTEIIQQDASNKDKFPDLFQEKEIASRTTLVNEGDVSNYMYFVKKQTGATTFYYFHHCISNRIYTLDSSIESCHCYNTETYT